ncbi:hypothetical protein ISS09_02435 [Candidatus Woesearchaeota archaeon]|nr:hypothetical protein [Candidatus Woesearchaeota archaeon]
MGEYLTSLEQQVRNGMMRNQVLPNNQDGNVYLRQLLGDMHHINLNFSSTEIAKRIGMSNEGYAYFKKEFLTSNVKKGNNFGLPSKTVGIEDPDSIVIGKQVTSIEYEFVGYEVVSLGEIQTRVLVMSQVEFADQGNGLYGFIQKNIIFRMENMLPQILTPIGLNQFKHFAIDGVRAFLDQAIYLCMRQANPEME